MTCKVPFLDLRSQSLAIGSEVAAAIQRVVDSCEFVLGSEVTAFEAAFAQYCGAEHGIAVNSGTSALHLALLAAGIGPGDEVVAPAMTFAATVAAVEYTGARAVLVDVDPNAYTMDPERLEEAIGKRTRAIVPVHLYGQPADMDPILEIASHHDLAVIEDAAQAHGARYKGRPVGSLGDIGCFSFYPGKNLGAFGEAGIVVCNDHGHSRTVRMLRDWGQEEKHHHVLKGFNYRMDGIQGAVLGVKLRHLESWTELRRARADQYRARLRQEGLAESSVAVPQARDDARHVYHIFAIRVRDRDVIRQELFKKGVQTGVHYPRPVHLIEAYRNLGYRQGDFPVAERLAEEELSLPMFPELTEAQLDDVCAALKEVVR